MLWISSFWLHLRLLWSIGFFLARVALAELAERKLAVASLATVLLLATITSLQVVKAVENTLTPPAPKVVTISTLPESAIYRLTPEEISEQLEYFLAILKEQPTHYQALLNAGILFEAQGDSQKSAEFFALAAQNNF